VVVMEEDRVRKLADIKTKLERRLEELEEEISLIRELLEVIDSILGSISFKPASELVKPEVVEKKRAPIKEVKVVSRRNKETIGKVIIYEDLLELVPTVKVRTSTPPFESFFIKRLLDKMKEEDLKKVREGVLNPEAVLEYEIIEEEGFLTKVLVRNCRDERRIRDIRGAFRWTLERMLDRERSS